MRLRFRIWDPRYKEFRYWGFMKPDIFTSVPSGGDMTLEYIMQNSEQAIGYFDADGLELWEGDIVETYCFNKARRHVIYYNAPTYAAKGTGYALNTVYFSGGPMKKIGNIHENPELIQL